MFCLLYWKQINFFYSNEYRTIHCSISPCQRFLQHGNFVEKRWQMCRIHVFYIANGVLWYKSFFDKICAHAKSHRQNEPNRYVFELNGWYETYHTKSNWTEIYNKIEARHSIYAINNKHRPTIGLQIECAECVELLDLITNLYSQSMSSGCHNCYNKVEWCHPTHARISNSISIHHWISIFAAK